MGKIIHLQFSLLAQLCLEYAYIFSYWRLRKSDASDLIEDDLSFPSLDSCSKDDILSNAFSKLVLINSIHLQLKLHKY